jgi:hypothetical protein
MEVASPVLLRAGRYCVNLHCAGRCFAARRSLLAQLLLSDDSADCSRAMIARRFKALITEMGDAV